MHVRLLSRYLYLEIETLFSFFFQDLWHEEGVPLYLRPYKIVCIGSDAGLIEPVLDTLSLHQIKRHLTNVFRMNGNVTTPSLKHHFENVFGPVNSETYVKYVEKYFDSHFFFNFTFFQCSEKLHSKHSGL